MSTHNWIFLRPEDNFEVIEHDVSYAVTQFIEWCLDKGEVLQMNNVLSMEQLCFWEENG